MKTPKDGKTSTFPRTTSRIGVNQEKEEMKKSNPNSKRFTNPTNYEIHKTTEQMYRVRFTNGLETRLSETGLERWGNIVSYEKEGTREIHYITM